MSDLSKDGTFRVVSFQKSDDSYMYSDTDYSYYVVFVATGDQLWSYFGSDYQNANGSKQDGTRSVDFTPEGDAFVVTGYDKSEERVELPSSVRMIDGGGKIEITWRDGRLETRDRNAVTTATRWGVIQEVPLVDDPDPEKKK